METDLAASITAEIAPATSMNWPALFRAGGAFTVIFCFYAGAASIGIPALLDELKSVSVEKPVTTKIFPNPAVPGIVDIQFTLVWMSVALMAAVLSVLAIGWCVAILRRYLVKQSFRISIAVLMITAVAAACMTMNNIISIVALPQYLGCGSDPILTGSRFLCGQSVEPHLHPTDWVAMILLLKTLLNVIFQTAAIVIIGTMLVVVSVCSASSEPASLIDRVVQDRVAMRLALVGGVVLSAITLADAMFVDWPIAVAAQASRAQLSGVMAAIILFYAMLGSTSLGLAITFSHIFSGGRLRWFPVEQQDGTLGTGVAWVRGFLLRESTLKALAALSPVLTYAFAHPAVKELAGAGG